MGYTFERDIYKALLKWKDSPFRKPLVLRGARQVGKTTAINIFSKEFKNYLYVNLEDNVLANLFKSTTNINDLLVSLFAIKGLVRKEGSTLLFIDEIQNCTEAIALLRYFYEESPGIHVIAAGSLLERLLGSGHISFPVGRVEYMAMRPLSFREFLTASGEVPLRTLIESTPTASIGLHSQLIELFNRYSLIGGMPEIVRAYMMTKDIISLGNLYTSLIEGYKDDSEKYASNKTDKEVIRFILSSGWSKAGETIKLTGFAESDYRSREVSEAFSKLQKAMLLELSYPTKSTNIPILPDLGYSPKLFWLDSGLVCYASGIQTEILTSKNILDVWKGRFAEQVAAQELLSITNEINRNRSFWVRNKKGSTAEVDFVYQFESTVIPIEVKSGHNSHLRSLHSFINTSENCDLAVRIWSEPYSVNELVTSEGRPFRLINLPFYLIGQLPQILKIESQ